MRARRVDENQSEVVAEFKRLGASVIDLSRVGMGVPDLCVGMGKRMALIEVKRDSKARYTPAQLDFRTWWTGPAVCRVETLEHVRQVVEFLRTGEKQ